MGSEIQIPAGFFEARARDELAERDLATILAELPHDHLARRAFARGRTTAEITNHLRDRRDLTHKVMNASWDHYRRVSPRIARNHTPR